MAALDLFTKGWAGLLTGPGLAQLEAVLPAWLPRQRWFGAKTRKIRSIRVLDWVGLPDPSSATHHDFTSADPSIASAIPPALFFVQVNYVDDNGPDVYQVPLAVSTGSLADEITANHSLSVLTTLTSSVGSAILHDATAREDFRLGLLSLIEHNTTLSLSSPHAGEPPEPIAAPASGKNAALFEVEPAPATGASAIPVSTSDVTVAPLPRPNQPVVPAPLTAQPGEIASAPRVGAPTVPMTSTQRRQPGESPSAGDPAPLGDRLDARASSAFSDAYVSQRSSSRVGTAEQSNTSIIYGKQLILKLFRRLQPGENPDVEIGRFLTEIARFPRIAPFLGEISTTTAAGEKTTVAMLQGLIANQGDGWEWFLDQLAGFFRPSQPCPIRLNCVPPASSTRGSLCPRL